MFLKQIKIANRSDSRQSVDPENGK